MPMRCTRTEKAAFAERGIIGEFLEGLVECAKVFFSLFSIPGNDGIVPERMEVF